jgi:nucleoside-diphosphate-sugar epimerase
VVALHRPGRAPEPLAGVRWLAQDLAQPLRDDLPARLDAVVHLAQSSRYREFPAGGPDMVDVNVACTARLLDLAVRTGASSFVLASTGAVYAAGPQPVREDDEPRPAGFYARSKLLGEQVADAYRAELPVAIVRPFFPYGPGQQPDRMLPAVLRRLRDGEAVTLAGEDGIRINPIFVDDLVRLLATVVADGRSVTVNAAGPDVVSFRTLATLAAGALGVEPRFASAAAAPDLVADVERLDALAAPSVGFADGVRRTAEWFQAGR